MTTPERAEKVVVASSDAHVGPRLSDLRPYCERSYLDDFDDFVRNFDPRPGRVSRDRPSEILDDFDWSKLDTAGHYDIHARLADLDSQGITAEVLFHGSQNGQPLPFMPTTSSFTAAPAAADQRTSELTYAGMRIYNRWLADFCRVAPNRQIGLAYLPLWDLDLAVEELQACRAAGLRGVNFPAPRPDLPDYNDPVWEPFWSACEETATPLNTHVGSETVTQILARYSGLSGMQIKRHEIMMLCQRGLSWLILGGVFERHPRLRYITTEVMGLGAWLPLTIAVLDELGSDRYGRELGLSKLPSAYFRENCFVGASFMSHTEAVSAIDHGWTDNFLWGSDYPHREGTYPWSRESLRMTMDGLQESVIRRMVGLNMLEVFDLDADCLCEIAARIGPTIEELTRPFDLASVPTEPAWIDYSMGFRQGLAWK